MPLALVSELASRRVVLFGGKGGVGKTTIAVATALQFSETKKTILFTTDPASNLGDIFGQRAAGSEQPAGIGQPTGNRQLAPAGQRAAGSGQLVIEEQNAEKLYARFLDTNLESLIELGDRGTYLDREELRRFFELSLPGVDELMAWMRIGELAEENSDAIVVVDTAPTGHALRMFAAAEHFAQFGRTLDAMQEKHRGMVMQFTRRQTRDAMDAFIENFEAQARRRRELLTDPARAAFVPVFLSESWVMEQTLRLMSEVEIAIPFAVLNRAVLEPDCALDVKRQKRDADARARIGIRVLDFARSCVPIWSGVSGYRGIEVSGLVETRSDAPIPRNPETPMPHSRLTFLAGKGGVGKTTCASSIALQLARTKRVTLISVDPAHSVRDVFAHEPPPPNLTVETIDTREEWRHFRETLGEEIDRAFDAIAPQGMTVAYDGEVMKQLVEIAPPGADELFAITRLAALIADESIDAIVVDTAPTGHFLRLLDLPHSAGEWVREFMRILLRYRDLIAPGSLGEELVHASRALKDLEETLRSDRASVIVVMRPEPIIVAETARLIADIERRGMHLGGVIANSMTPANDCACDRSMRAHELALVGDATLIERRDVPPLTLGELAGLFRVTSD